MAVDAVGIRAGRGLGEQDGELAAGAGGDDVSVADGGVVDDGGGLDIVNGALAGLVVGGEPPRVDLTLLSDGKAIVRTSADGANARNV